MAINKLQICYEVLQKLYLEKLTLGFAKSVDQIEGGQQPVWRLVSAEDLTTEIGPEQANGAAVLLDPEIGVLSYILPFDKSTQLKKQVVRCLSLRSRLLIERNYTGAYTNDSDLRGAWRIILHWLVEKGAQSEWIDQITAIRRETGFSEELSFDAIFLNSGDFKTEIENYCFPRLLITMREVLRKPHLKDTAGWISANKLVEEALLAFPKQFEKRGERILADGILRSMKEFLEEPPTAPDIMNSPPSPRTIHMISMRDFRNLRNAQFDFGTQPVGASIIHGPNGTGKSSICEAISLALFRSSYRYKWFADVTREKDAASKDRAEEYLKKYLTPVASDISQPRIALDEECLSKPELVDADHTEEVDLAMTGTILTQDASLEFSRMPASELGVRVLRGYSELADHIDEFAKSRADQASANRVQFLRRFEISAQITKIDTAYERIAKAEVNKALPSFPQGLVAWLESVARASNSMKTELPSRWREWGDEKGRNQLARELSGSNTSQEGIAGNLRRWLDRYNALVMETAEFVKRIDDRLGTIRKELNSSSDRLAAWGEWLERKELGDQHLASSEAETIKAQLQKLQIEQQSVLERGRTATAQCEHLAQVEAFVRESWTKHHSDDCPTCGANHSGHGGILKVVESLRKTVLAQRDNLRHEYSTFKPQVERAQKQLAVLGQADCPLSEDERAALAESLQWLTPSNVSLADWIADKNHRGELLRSISDLRQTPSIPPKVNADFESEKASTLLFKRFQEAAEIFDTPTNWKPVIEALRRTLAAIVNEHLPKTLARLWTEIVLNLTSAPWLLPAQPCLDAKPKRGESTLTIRIKDRLARHILNQAENHTLGLGWFFTRYLTFGRFHHSSIVMDDPAHELDQTSFRELCRLWETMMRLHRVHERPLKIIVMLNQESRALEATRATGGTLTVLDWVRDQENISTPVRIVGEGFHAPQPLKLFAQTGS